jgi:hypothetical protein
MKRLLLASCVTALLAAGPLAAQTSPGQPRAAAIPGAPGSGTGTPGPTFPPPPIESTRPWTAPPLTTGRTPDPAAPRPPVVSETDRPMPERIEPIDPERRR